MVLVPKTYKIHVFFKGDVLFWKKKAPARNATHSRPNGGEKSKKCFSKKSTFYFNYHRKLKPHDP